MLLFTRSRGGPRSVLRLPQDEARIERTVAQLFDEAAAKTRLDRVCATLPTGRAQRAVCEHPLKAWS